MPELLLALNVGSSSLKFQASPPGDLSASLLSGAVERVGSDQARLKLRRGAAAASAAKVDAPDHARALAAVAESLAAAFPDANVQGVGHRIVHGGAAFAAPVEATSEVLADLDALVPLAPLHQPHGLAGVRAAKALFPAARHVVCFDTGFHAGKPWVHSALALPRAHHEAGLRRYGFHGLSCQSILRSLRAEGYPVAERKLVIAHLGNGCSVTAVLNGASLANSMGFSTLDGLTMGSRCGRIDPGALLHLLRNGMSPDELETLLYKRSGLLGLSGVSNDMRDLEASDAPEARDAIDYFVARAVEEIARAAAALRGLDAVVFCGGIGENAKAVREAIVDGIAFLSGRDGGGVEALVRETKEEEELLRAVAARG